jgi:integrase
MTFEQFADWYKLNYVFEPNYEQGQQVAGLRTYKNVRLQIDRLKTEFGKKKIARIDDEILHQFKNKRKNIDKVKTATINRDLELLRAMFNKAVKQSWLEESPFDRAENLIRKSLEARRKVTVSNVEEKLVLEAARKSENKYLYPLILALRDTGARPSELYPYSAYKIDLNELPKKIKFWLENEVNSDEQIFLPLCWFQLFKVEFQVVPLISLKSRQIEYRFGTMTTRLRESLLDLWEKTDKEIVSLVFPFKSIKKEWQKVRDETKLLDLRIRDWRRIWRSKADLAGVPEQTAQRILGHKLLETTYHYNEADLQAVVEAGRKMDELNLVTETVN